MTLNQKWVDPAFKTMQGVMWLIDKVHPYVQSRAASFGIQPGMTVVDYGCGPGRYTVEFAKLVGKSGKVYAVDLLEIALKETEKRLQINGVNNVNLKLAQEYNSGIKQKVADMICAVDMFHHVDPAPFLKEMDRIAKPDGVLILSGGHMLRSRVKEAVAASGLWALAEENKRFLRYTKERN